MTIRLEGPDAVVTIDADAGGRIAQLTVQGHDLLVDGVDDPLQWGCYPMVPWAGRLRNGTLRFHGTDYSFPLNLPPHAIHGLGVDRRWQVVSPNELRLSLPWAFGGEVGQRFELRAGSLRLSMTVAAGDRPMPVACGWHPWFRRPVELSLDAAAMYERGPDHIPSGRLVPPKPPPWDDCFTELRRAPRLRWPHGLSLTVSGPDHFVVYTELAHAVCVEPQTGPPNALVELSPHSQFRVSALFAWRMDERDE